ncbi:hypothetical protein BGZ73_006932 [Actinomortierella ambigua]|nr:hypothetical protein BGZ73_006932 [Actinomortierella ambigua]
MTNKVRTRSKSKQSSGTGRRTSDSTASPATSTGQGQEIKTTSSSTASNTKCANGDAPSIHSDDKNVKFPVQQPPPIYIAIRAFFTVCLHAFYANVEVEGTENISPTGPAILVANHSNSLTDAVAVLSTVPSKSRKMLRMTAKDTFWHTPSIFGYLIRSVGTVPIKRRKDYNGQKVDNSVSMDALIESLGTGSCVCLYPEGISRYNPQMAPFKAGVAMIASDALSRYKDQPGFNLTLLPASINYLHREKFRSDVLVTYHSPIVLTPHQDSELISTDKQVRQEAITKLTTLLENIVRSNLLDAQDWRTVRIGHIARKIYAGQLGTRISLGQYVRLTAKFVTAFGAHADATAENNQNGKGIGGTNGSRRGSVQEESVVNAAMSESTLQPGLETRRSKEMSAFIQELARDLEAYQKELDCYRLKDYRITQGKPPAAVLLSKLFQRFLLACLLAVISIPGLLLWAPVFLAAKYQEKKIRRKGPLEDNLDEIAQYKLLVATMFLPLIWGFWVMMTFPFALFTAPGIIILMWLTIRWLEDLVHNAKSMLSLLRLLFIAEGTMENLRDKRLELAKRVQQFAVNVLDLPEDPEDLVAENKVHKQSAGWLGHLSNSYFSIKRRRRKDWNEVMRLHDVSNYDQ